MTPTYNQFTFLHEDGEDRILYEFKAVTINDIMRKFTAFLKGCGHYDACILSSMEELVEEYRTHESSF
ncbi:MAG: hypothetical protein EBT86_09955 [Actinobacteria bacterium]|nr:hypothetical protein [Actinomycetota bacterium]